MKKIALVVLLAVTMMNAASMPAYAASASSVPFVVGASVDGTLTLTVVLKKNDSAGAVVAGMDFGKLVNIGTGTLRSSPTSTTGTGAIAAFITANSHSVPYTITQTGTALSNGSAVLPAGALVVKPVYVPADNGNAALPAGATVASAGTWVATNKTLYTSGPTGATRTITTFYSITDDATAGSTASVPVDQAGGNYSGTVTITVTA